MRKLEVDREKIVETALMEKAIALYQKSLEQSAAQAEAENAKARATEAAEKVITVRESEIARRRKTIEVLIAEKEAEETRIGAEAERIRAAVEAEAQKLINEAENVLTEPARASLFKRKLLEHIEGIVRESVKPMEKIEGIRILHVDGLNGGGGGRQWPQRDGRSDRFGAALSSTGAADRLRPLRDRHRGRQSLEDAGTDPRGARLAGHSQGSRAPKATDGPPPPRARQNGGGGSPRKKS